MQSGINNDILLKATIKQRLYLLKELIQCQDLVIPFKIKNGRKTCVLLERLVVKMAFNKFHGGRTLLTRGVFG